MLVHHAHTLSIGVVVDSNRHSHVIQAKKGTGTATLVKLLALVRPALFPEVLIMYLSYEDFAARMYNVLEHVAALGNRTDSVLTAML